MKTDFDQEWPGMTEEVLRGMKGWRIEHGQATLSEIERALDERLGKLRVRLIEDMAEASGLADLRSDGEGVKCGSCGEEVKVRGQHERQLLSEYNQTIRLRRSYGVCPGCGVGFFPPGRRIRVNRRDVDPANAGESGAVRGKDALCAGG